MSRMIVLAVLGSLILPGQALAQALPPAGSAGAGNAPISGVPYGPANPRSLSDPSGIGSAAARAEARRLGNLGSMLAYGRTLRRAYEETGGEAPGHEIPLPGAIQLISDAHGTPLPVARHPVGESHEIPPSAMDVAFTGRGSAWSVQFVPSQRPATATVLLSPR